MLDTITSKLETYLGRQFILGSYLPSLIFGALNLVPAYFGFVYVQHLAREAISSETDALHRSAYYLAVVLLAPALIALMSQPLMPFIQRRLQEGGPGCFAKLLVTRRASKREKLRENLKVAQRRRAQLPTEGEMEAMLMRHRSRGLTLKGIKNESAINDAEGAIEVLRDKQLRDEPVDAPVLLNAVTRLAEALRSNCAEVPPRVMADDRKHAYQNYEISGQITDEGRKKAIQLDELYDKIKVLIRYAIDRADYEEWRCKEKLQRNYADRELAPTVLGNGVARLREYCDDRYGFDFDFFWPRLMLIVQKDEKLSETIVAAKTRVDFWILSLTLSMLSTALWLLWFIFSALSPLIAFIFSALYSVIALCRNDLDGSQLFQVLSQVSQVLNDGWKIVGGVTFFGVLSWPIFSSAMHGSYEMFAEAVRSAVDTKRFDLLDSFNFPRPTDVVAEKKLWKEIAYWMQLGGQPPAHHFVAAKGKG